MYIESVPNRSSPPAILLRESFRDRGRVKKRTLANLSKLPAAAIDALRRILRGEQLVQSRRRLHLPPQPPPRPRRRRARHRPQARTRRPARPQPRPPPRPRPRTARRPRHRRAVEARHRPRPDARKRRLHARRDAQPRHRRPEGAVRRDGLARRAAGGHRAAPGQASPPGTHPRALRPDLQLRRGDALPTRPARPQPRPQEGHAPDRLRSALHRLRVSGRRRGLRRLDQRPQHRRLAGRQDPHPLRPPPRGARRRPRDADRGPHPRGPRQRRRAALDHHAARTDHPQAGGGRNRHARRCSTNATSPRSPARISPASG